MTNKTRLELDARSLKSHLEGNGGIHVRCFRSRLQESRLIHCIVDPAKLKDAFMCTVVSGPRSDDTMVVSFDSVAERGGKGRRGEQREVERAGENQTDRNHAGEARDAPDNTARKQEPR